MYLEDLQTQYRPKKWRKGTIILGPKEVSDPRRQRDSNKDLLLMENILFLSQPPVSGLSTLAGYMVLQHRTRDEVEEYEIKQSSKLA